MTDQPANVNLRLSADEAALAKAQQGVALVNSRLKELKQTAQDAGQSADTSLARIGTSTSKLTDGWKQYEEQVLAAKKATDSLADSTAKASSGGSFGVEGLRRTGGALSQLGLGEIGGPVSRIGDVAQIGKEFGELEKTFEGLAEAGNLAQLATAATSTGLGTLALAAGPVVAVLAGFTIGMQIFNAEIAEGQKQLKAALDNQQDYYTFIQTATKQDVENRIKAEQQKAAAAKAAQAETEAAIERAKSQLGVSGLARELADKLPILKDLYTQ
jgi:hypothetical protein